MVVGICAYPLPSLFANQCILHTAKGQTLTNLFLGPPNTFRQLKSHAILEEEELIGAVVLLFTNKQDLPGALDGDVTETLESHKMKSRQWAIFKTSAIKGEGIFEGLDWLSNTLKSGRVILGGNETSLPKGGVGNATQKKSDRIILGCHEDCQVDGVVY